MSAALHDDERYCPPGKLLRAMHKKFLQSPVMGLADDFSKLCVHTKKIATTFHGARDDLCVLKTLLRDMEKDPYHPTNGSCLYTWKVAGSRLVTVFKVDEKTTVIWDQASEFAFEAAPCASLGPWCPVGTALLGQAVMDRINASNPLWEVDESCDNAWTINILLFDILSFGTDKNFMKDACTVTERYELLRSLQDPVMQVISPESSIKVQWAGHLKALVEFDCTNRDTLPHIVDCYLRLGWKDPSTVRLLKRTVDKMDCESEEEDIGNGGVV